MKRKTKVRIARFTRQVPILREMQALRNESVLRLVVQAAFVGGCTGGVIGVFRWLYDHGNAWIVSTLRHGADDLATALIVFGTLILLALIVGQMVRKEPLISGSGIPQTELALAGQLPYPGFRIVASKFVGTLLSLSGGLSVGREGPSIQMGAAVGCGVGRIWHDDKAQTMPRYLIGGSVAGLTAAFGAPAAGTLDANRDRLGRLRRNGDLRRRYGERIGILGNRDRFRQGGREGACDRQRNAPRSGPDIIARGDD